MQNDDDALIVLCTVPSEEVGAKLARGLVESRLAACVNILPGLRSIYAWKGDVCDDAELQLVVKTRRGRFEAVAAYVGEHHPYDVPEVLALPVVAGSSAYLGWLREQTADEP